MLNQLTMFQQLDARMHWLTDRQNILSSNIANADTPGYAAKDLGAMSFKQQLGAQLAMQTSEAGHLAGFTPNLTSKAITIKADSATPDGNTVSLEDELQKSSQTSMDYQLASQLYAKNKNMLRIAVGSSK